MTLMTKKPYPAGVSMANQWQSEEGLCDTAEENRCAKSCEENVVQPMVKKPASIVAIG